MFRVIAPIVGLSALLVMATGATVVLAQDESSELPEMIESLEQSVKELQAFSEQIAIAPERHREALVYRQDERRFQVLRQLDRVVEQAAALPEDDPVRLDLTKRLQDDLVGATETVIGRIEEIAQRVADHNAELESLAGAERVTAQAHIHSLEKLRFQYYRSLVDMIEGKQSLGLPAEKFSGLLRGRLQLHAETLVGRIDFNGSALDDVNARLSSDPENADVVTVQRDLAARQNLNLERLELVVDLLGRLGQDTTAYKTVLLKQADGLSLATFEKGALVTVLGEGWDNLKGSLTESAPDFLFKLIIFLAVLFVFRVLSRVTRRAVRAGCERPGVEMSTLLKDVTESLAGGTVMGIGILMALSQVGISLGPMLAGLGVAGFIVGFALQDTLGNFAAGGMILIYRPYDVDDLIEVAGATGLVKKMSLVSTTIATVDNQTLVVPNSKIWGDVIKNVTAQRVRRVDLLFGIGYGDDVEKAERVLNAIVSEHDKVLDRPETVVKLHELGDSSINFVVRPWVRTEDYWDVYWDLTREVKMRFDREGISIPFPQRDVHIYQQDA
jgi:small conductance mechanosensitive channel